MERKNPASTRQDVRTADGFAAAVKSIERLLFAVSYSVLGNSDACSDAVQSALLKAWKNRLTLQNGARFKSILSRYSGRDSVVVQLQTDEGVKQLKMGDEHRVDASASGLHAELKELLGSGAVWEA